MTEEQIKQNAEAYASKLVERDYHEDIWLDLYDAHIAGAQSRDEEIEELQNEIESLRKGFYERGDKLKELMLTNNQLRNPWVSVEERTPNFVEENAYNKLSGNNIVRVRNNQTGKTRVDTALYIQSKETKRCVWAIHELWYDEEVTHWMEIPE